MFCIILQLTHFYSIQFYSFFSSVFFFPLFIVYFDLSCFFFFKQKTAYEMRISDWSSDVCSSDLLSEADLRSGADNVASFTCHVVGVAKQVRLEGIVRLHSLHSAACLSLSHLTICCSKRWASLRAAMRSARKTTRVPAAAHQGARNVARADRKGALSKKNEASWIEKAEKIGRAHV